MDIGFLSTSTSLASIEITSFSGISFLLGFFPVVWPYILVFMLLSFFLSTLRRVSRLLSYGSSDNVDDIESDDSNDSSSTGGEIISSRDFK